MKPNNNLTVALYERLSHDDEQQGESFSISNQKLLLETYAREHGMNNYKHFFDDGISGTRFDRPGFMAMMNGIKDGEIGTVIVKDMSRLGRDYLMVGQIQEMLRQKKVRLIAINDNHDSIHGDDDLLPFKNIMNEWYAKDTSKKIRSTFQAKGKAGKHVASSPVYGYIKNPENKEEWIVDREAAEVVKRIYRRTVEGAGPYQIARELEADKIDIPAVHLQKLGFGLHQKVKFDEPYHWWGSTVTHLLDKREYLGHTVNFKTRKHFKDKKSHYVDESEWLIFENTHEPIIDEETWNIVHRIRGNCKRYPNGWGEVNPLTGIVVCADCGRPMHQHRTSNGKRECNYVCANYSKSPVGTVCPTGHRVKGEAVLELVKQTLRDIRAYVDIDEEGFLKEMEKGVEDEHRDEIILAQRKIDSNNKRLGEIESLFCRMYEDNILGKLPDSRYEALSKQYDAEQERLRHEICEIEKTLAGFHTETKDGKKFLNIIKKYDNFDELTPYMLNELVEKIAVHERDRKGSRDTTQKIDIYFSFIGCYLPPQEEPDPEEQARLAEELAKREEWKDKCHQRYLKYRKSGKYKAYEKSYEGRRRALMAEKKANNPNPYGISIAEYREQIGEPKVAK